MTEEEIELVVRAIQEMKEREIIKAIERLGVKRTLLSRNFDSASSEELARAIISQAEGMGFPPDEIISSFISAMNWRRAIELLESIKEYLSDDMRRSVVASILILKREAA